MTQLADAHYALVLREIVRFAEAQGVDDKSRTLKAPGPGSSTFLLTFLSSPNPSYTYRGKFERLTGGEPHAAWHSPSFSFLGNDAEAIGRTLQKERGVVRSVRQWRWQWHELQLREEALMWAGLIRLRVAHERWLDRDQAELMLTEEPGRSFTEPYQVGEQARAIQEFLRVFASLKADVHVENVRGEVERTLEPRTLSATDEWAHARSCEITVKVLGEIPAAPFVSDGTPGEGERSQAGTQRRT